MKILQSAHKINCGKLWQINSTRHAISYDAICMDLAKLKVIEEWPQPKNLHELQIFIGMCSYYHRFENFSMIASTLLNLTKNKNNL